MIHAYIFAEKVLEKTYETKEEAFDGLKRLSAFPHIGHAQFIVSEVELTDKELAIIAVLFA